jgi:hypothetical protein
LTTTSNIVSFKSNCFKSFSVQFLICTTFHASKLVHIGPIWFASLEVDLSMSPMWGMFTFVDVCKHSAIRSFLTSFCLHFLSLTNSLQVASTSNLLVPSLVLFFFCFFSYLNLSRNPTWTKKNWIN